MISLKGKLSKKNYWPKVFIGPKLREVSKGNFHRKAPKLVRNQVEGSKIDQIRTKRPTATVGIHQFRSTATVGIHLLLVGGFLQ